MIVDFHSHTRESDGALAPDELVAMIGQGVYDQLLAFMDERSKQPKGTMLPHPVRRVRA